MDKMDKFLSTFVNKLFVNYSVSSLHFQKKLVLAIFFIFFFTLLCKRQIFIVVPGVSTAFSDLIRSSVVSMF